MKMLTLLWEKVWCLFAVTYWLQDYDHCPYSKGFDNWCREELKKGTKFKNTCEFKGSFGGKQLWITNHPYASLHLYENGEPQVSPSRYTKRLLKKRLSESWE